MTTLNENFKSKLIQNVKDYKMNRHVQMEIYSFKAENNIN